MKTVTTGICLGWILSLVVLTQAAYGAGKDPAPDSPGNQASILGETLLRKLWADMKETDLKAINETIAEGFQAVHQDGANNRRQEIELISKLDLSDYTLSDIKITQDGPVIVATYFVSVSETIKGKRLSKKPAPRLSVFLKTDKGWKWVAHANLKPL